VKNIVTNLDAKFNNDRLRNEKALGLTLQEQQEEQQRF